MDILSKIQKMVGMYNDNKNELVSGGRVVKAGAIRQMPTKCSICGKMFKVENNQINYFYNHDATFNFMCDKCYEKLLDSWTVVDVEQIVPNGVNGGGLAKGCKMKDGIVKDVPYGQFAASTSGEIPDIFSKTLAPFRQKYHDEQQKLYCTNVEVIDTWEETKIIATFGDGKSYDIYFKSSVDGIRYNPNDLKELTQDQIYRINKELQDRLYSKYYIREVK